MQARMRNPVVVLPAALEPLLALSKVSGALPESLRHLIHLRISQINGCAACIDGHIRTLKEEGGDPAKSLLVAAWRDAPSFTSAERAALALAEALTRLADAPEPISDTLWAEAEAHFDEAQRAALIVSVATTNVWNRLNVAVRQLPGAWV
jgi:AhpD family alkylhydroperoxidase